jgi:hypothetical protein
MMKEPILVDVDLTFVDSGTPWMDWLVNVNGCNPDFSKSPENGQIHYNLGKYFPAPGEYGVCPFEFWEDPYLYDKLRPMFGAVSALESLKKEGHPIRFVSHCKTGHFSSKARFLKRECGHFLDLEKGTTGDGFYATKVKSGVSGRVIIDDRNEFLNQFSDDVIKIKFKTSYTQTVPPRVGYDLETNSWLKIKEFILDTI